MQDNSGIRRGEVLSLPRSRGSQVERFLDHVRRNIDAGVVDYSSLHTWSISHPSHFWSLISEWFDVRWHNQPTSVLEATQAIVGSRWWQGGTLNFTDRIAQMAVKHENEVAVVGYSDSRQRVELTWSELLKLVAHYRQILTECQVAVGERVVAYLPNVPETVAIFLACASIGAVFSSSPPEFGEDAVISRFGQIAPVVLFYVTEYRYGNRRFDKSNVVKKIVTALPSLRHIREVNITQIDDLRHATENSLPLECVSVSSDHPLYILYSSGTTGLPKPIILGHAGILHEHLKIMALHHDLKHGERLLWYSTTGWVMWNYQVSSLLVGTTVVLYDGDPVYPDSKSLWSVAGAEKVTMLGLGANFINNCLKEDLKPGELFDLTALRIVGSTGSPLSAGGFHWVKNSVGDHAVVHSICGGTDLGTAFLGMSPLLPVHAGEMSCAVLGADVRALRPDGSECDRGETGELVLSTPMPSMPIGLWSDVDGARLRATYFDDFPGNWRHGDWITIFDDGMSVVSGRSDATLNRGGVRLGTAEFYAVVEALPFVFDSLVVHFAAAGEELGRLLLFVKPRGSRLDESQRAEIVSTLRSRLSPRHIPDEIIQVAGIPRTLSGKKLEIPVKKILLGAERDQVCSIDSLSDPKSLDEYVVLRSRFNN